MSNKGREFSVMTFNVYMNGFQDEAKASRTIEAILSSDIDVVCLQECNSGWEDLILKALASSPNNYEHTYFQHDMGRYGGRCVLSKYPIVSAVWFGRIFRWWYGALKVTLRIADTESFHILSVHLRAPFPSNPFHVQKQRLQEIRTHCERITDADFKNLLILGDFNTPRGPCHEYLRTTRKMINALQEKRKLCRTWHWGPLLGACFDHIYYTPLGNIHLTDCEVLTGKGGSDHWPVCAKFRIQ